jgi:zinc D-Ala-D-Ala dipeptidase
MRGPIVVHTHRPLRMGRRRFLGVAAAAILWPAATAAIQAPPPNTDELPLASDAEALALLVDVQAVAPTLVVDARYHGYDNFTGAPLPGYEANKVLLRWEVAEALARVQDGLAQRRLGLKVWDGYRPVRATLWMVEWAEASGNAWLLEQEWWHFSFDVPGALPFDLPIR